MLGLVSACDRGSAERGTPAAAVAAPAPTFVEFAKAPDPPRACIPSTTSGTHVLEVAGSLRKYVLDLPEREGLHPLVLAFHGWGGDPEQLEGTTRIVQRAVARGWIVARPIGTNKSFAAGTCCGEAVDLAVDDVGFARTLVSALEREACVDPSRVYATGFSNGGFLSHRLACEAPEVFAAVASVAGPLGVPCHPDRAVPVMHVHGKQDGIVPFAGNSAKAWRSVASTIETWTTIDGCTPGASEELYAKGSARCVRNGACKDGSEVVLCRDDVAAHTWPGGPHSTGWGGTQDLDATGMILDFFARHAR